MSELSLLSSQVSEINQRLKRVGFFLLLCSNRLKSIKLCKTEIGSERVVNQPQRGSVNVIILAQINCVYQKTKTKRTVKRHKVYKEQQQQKQNMKRYGEADKSNY